MPAGNPIGLANRVPLGISEPSGRTVIGSEDGRVRQEGDGEVAWAHFLAVRANQAQWRSGGLARLDWRRFLGLRRSPLVAMMESADLADFPPVGSQGRDLTVSLSDLQLQTKEASAQLLDQCRYLPSLLLGVPNPSDGHHLPHGEAGKDLGIIDAIDPLHKVPGQPLQQGHVHADDRSGHPEVLSHLRIGLNRGLLVELLKPPRHADRVLTLRTELSTRTFETNPYEYSTTWLFEGRGRWSRPSPGGIRPRRGASNGGGRPLSRAEQGARPGFLRGPAYNEPGRMKVRMRFSRSESPWGSVDRWRSGWRLRRAIPREEMR